MLFGTYKRVLYQDLIMCYEYGKNHRDNLTSHILYLFVVVKFKDPLWSLKRFSSPVVETKSNPVDSMDKGKTEAEIHGKKCAFRHL